MEMRPLVAGGFKIVQGRQPDLPITEEPHFTWVPYFSTVVPAGPSPSVIASVFYPASMKDADFTLEATAGAPVVSYSAGGQTVRYVFKGDTVERK